MPSGPASLSWGPPRWTTSGEAPRILQRGDLLQAELMPLCGNQEVQVQMTVALDPIDETNRTCERVARASYDAGIKALRPGISFADLVAAMEEPLKQGGCWGYTPLVHSLGPHFLMGRTTVNQDQAKLDVSSVGTNAMRQRKAVMAPGMVLAFEPNACMGDHRVNIGGTVVVTATGCEELNHIPTTVAHKQ
jgi:Xaa-Pro aminopeptidase